MSLRNPFANVTDKTQAEARHLAQEEFDRRAEFLWKKFEHLLTQRGNENVNA